MSEEHAFGRRGYDATESDHDLLIRIDERTARYGESLRQLVDQFEKFENRVTIIESAVASHSAVSLGVKGISDRIWMFAAIVIGPLTAVTIKLADRLL